VVRKLLGENGLIQAYIESHNELQNLKNICVSQSLEYAAEILNEIVKNRKYNGYIVIKIWQNEPGYDHKILAGYFDGQFIDPQVFCEPEPLPQRLQNNRPTQIARVSEGATAQQSGLLKLLSSRGVAETVAVYKRAVASEQIGLIALSNDSAKGDRPRLTASLPVLRLALYALSETHIETARPEKAQRLSRTQSEVLQAFARGLSPNEIAELRGTSIRTVRNQLEAARKRLGARSNAHAIAIAIERRAILNPSANFFEPSP